MGYAKQNRRIASTHSTLVAHPDVQRAAALAAASIWWERFGRALSDDRAACRCPESDGECGCYVDSDLLREAWEAEIAKVGDSEVQVAVLATLRTDDGLRALVARRIQHRFGATALPVPVMVWGAGARELGHVMVGEA